MWAELRLPTMSLHDCLHTAVSGAREPRGQSAWCFPREHAPPGPVACPHFIIFSVLGRKSLRGTWVILPRNEDPEY